jgi:hypothetical protein
MRTEAEQAELQTELDNWRGKGYTHWIMPAASRFDELFSAATYDKTQAPEPDRLPAWDAERGETVPLGPYCRVERKANRFGPALYVKARPELVKAILARYIAGKYDALTFQIIEWADGRALVKYENSQIIGGGWITMIDAATIP